MAAGVSEAQAIWCVAERRGWGSIAGYYITTGRSRICIVHRTKKMLYNHSLFKKMSRKVSVVSHIET